MFDALKHTTVLISCVSVCGVREGILGLFQLHSFFALMMCSNYMYMNNNDYIVYKNYVDPVEVGDFLSLTKNNFS